MLLFRCLVLLLFHRKLIGLHANLAEGQVRVLELQVEEDTTWYFLADGDKPLTGHSELPAAVQFEFLDLSVHVIQEDA